MNKSSTVRAILLSFISMIPVLLSIGCAAIHRPVPPPYDAADLISNMMEQEGKVSSFYASGTVLIKGWALQSEADLLIAGTRDPLKIKIEITSPWGMPILHILVDNNRLEVLSFNEKRVYIGNLTSESLSRFFIPEGFSDHNIIWSVLRGYPYITGYDRVISSDGHRIRLLNREDVDIEIIDLSPQTLLPTRVLFPQDSLDISFSGFNKYDGIDYAEQVIVNNVEGGKDLVLKTRKMVFNNPVPEEIFTLEKPETFETFNMN